ncbi:glycosyltransferase family A protein [Candidatus Formimonas warabiya]|uniref:Glycosyltransferase n=1 Tax=Formimonas warabiya TaxID=1761012 RepID=A0A3G1KU12_FORW1|nr:glycosyltransferase family A protein [Candidatus Formimonas warabiya]ATW25936.1 hypothetical protein DCMF_15175 [Candidatus Formimonas warabiya]
MTGLFAFLSVLAGYGIILAVAGWFMCKAKLAGKKNILILILKNSADSVEYIMWDVFRLQSWNYRDFSFMVIDDKSEDDTLSILKAIRERHPFVLVSASVGKRFERMKRWQGENVRVLSVVGPEPPRLVRKRMVVLLNECRLGSEFQERSFM